MHLELGGSGTLIDGSPSWDAAATSALSIWNTYLLRLQFSPVVDSRGPVDADGVNNVFFSSTIYGDDFGDAVAVTTEWDVPGNRSVRREADVIFNAGLSWNSYRGSLRDTSGGETIYDLRRVALHEFGHVVGLDHPDEAGQSVTAIMNSRVSNVDDLQPDDIRGGQFLYGAQPGTAVGESLGTITRPAGKNTIATGASALLLGSADPSLVQAVFLTNSRLPGRSLKAKGLKRWHLSMPLKMGRNVIRMYARGTDGSRTKVDQRVITRVAPN
jgi:hypothetical protein